MTGLADTTKQALLDVLADPGGPALYLGLASASVGTDGTAAPANEIASGDGYTARLAITFEDPASSGNTGVVASINSQQWTKSGTGSWSVSHVFISTSSTIGATGWIREIPLTSTVTVESGVYILFDTGDVTQAVV